MFFNASSEGNTDPLDPNDIGAVEIEGEPGLWIGNREKAADKDFLKRNGITHILAVGAMLPVNFPNEFVYESIFCLDTEEQNLLAHLKRCITFMKSALGPTVKQRGILSIKKIGDDGAGVKCGGVFVHCHYGKSRSATVVIAYLMKIHKWKFEKCYEVVRRSRPCICPNESFIRQLRMYEDMGYKIDKKSKMYKQLCKKTMP